MWPVGEFRARHKINLMLNLSQRGKLRRQIYWENIRKFFNYCFGRIWNSCTCRTLNSEYNIDNTNIIHLFLEPINRQKTRPLINFRLLIGIFTGNEADFSVVKHKGVCIIFPIMTNTSIELSWSSQKKMTCVHLHNITPSLILVF